MKIMKKLILYKNRKEKADNSMPSCVSHPNPEGFHVEIILLGPCSIQFWKFI